MQAAERDAGGDGGLAEAVARQYARLLAVKDEYEVARLYTDGGFERTLAEQFERWDALEYHFAPPLLTRPGPDGRPRKWVLGAWVRPLLVMLAAMRRIRGSWFDPFGHTAERRLERELARQYEEVVAEVIAGLKQQRPLDLARAILQVPDHIRGYGHVKLGNWVTARAQWQELLPRWRGGDSAGGGTSQADHRMPVPDSQRGSLRSQQHPVP